MEALAQFYQGKALLPDSFTANNRVEDIQAMYVPFWLFDTEIKAAASYRATKQNVVKTEEETITTTHHYACERAGKMSFKAIPVDGSEKMNDTYMESIEPFDYSELTPFSTAYLTGYLADKYDVDAEKAVLRADERIASSAEECLRDTVNGYATVKQEGGTIINKGESSVSYAMVPVWILTTRFEDKPYTFMMNGQIGKVVGSLPIDNGKLRNQTIITFIIIFLLAFAATGFGMKQGGAPFRLDEVTLGIALAITLLGTWLRRSSLIASMSNVRDASSANAYLEKDKFDLTLHDDTYLFSNTVVTKRQQKEKG